jgi:hypothetical protein
MLIPEFVADAVPIVSPVWDQTSVIHAKQDTTSRTAFVSVLLPNALEIK